MKMVSVIMITYNHELFIKEAIEGVLMQECDFEVELIVADDMSPDNTEKVVLDLIQNNINGHRINYTKHSKNKGMNENFFWAAKQASGKYIAICEGDDYWTDPYKLQKQVDFLEENEGCVYTFHRVNELKDGCISLDELNPENKSRFELEDVLKKNYAHTPSIVLRKPDFSKFPSFFATAMPGDHTLQILLLKDDGYAHFMKDAMAVYRRHDGGIWSSDGGASFSYESAITKINIYKYLGIEDSSICYGLANCVADNGLNKIALKEYYRLMFTQLSFRDAFKKKNRYLMFSWMHFLLKKRRLHT